MNITADMVSALDTLSGVFDMIYEQLKTEKRFSRSEYFAAIEELTGKTSSDALAYALRKDLANGEIVRIGRNQYSFLKSKLIYTHTYSEDACCIASEIKTDYPDVDFRIFELTQLNSFVNHQIAHNTLFISVENDVIDFVFDSLRQKYPGRIMLKPNLDEYYRYLVDNQLVLIRLPSESPKGLIQPWESKLEKILVDISVDKLISRIVSPGEYENIFPEAFSRYHIDLNSMFRYARRKGAIDRFTAVLKEYVPFALKDNK